MKRNRIIMLCINILQGLVFYGPISTVYRQSRGISISQIFLMESIFLVVSLLLEIPWGIAADRFGCRKVVITSNIVFFISKIVFLYASSFQAFMIERILLAAAVSGLSGCDSALIYESLDGENPQKFFGRYHALGTISFVAASAVGSIIASKSYELTAFLTVISYFAAVIFSFYIKEPEVNKNNTQRFAIELKGVIKYLCTKHSLIYISILYGILDVIMQAMVFLNQPQFVRSGINIAYFGIIISGLELVRISADRTHVLTKKFGEGTVMVMLPMSIGIFYLVLSITSRPALTILSMAAITASHAMLEPLTDDILNRDIKDGRATVLSVYSWISSAAGIIINPIIGKLSGMSLKISFAFLGLMGAVVSILLYFIVRNFKVFNKNQL